MPEPRSVTGRPIASCWRLIAVNMACTCAVVRSASRICPGHGAAAADAAAAPVQRWRQLQRQVPASVSFRAAQRAPRTHPPAAGLVAAPAPAVHASLCIHGGPLPWEFARAWPHPARTGMRPGTGITNRHLGDIAALVELLLAETAGRVRAGAWSSCRGDGRDYPGAPGR